MPFLRQLSDHVGDEVPLPQGGGELGVVPQGTASSSSTTRTTAVAAATSAGGGGAGGPGVDCATAGGLGSGVGVPDGLERVRLDAERQILLTMLLAHMCSEHDATPRTFVEQVGVRC